VPDLYKCNFEKECLDLPLDFDENAQNMVRSSSFYHDTDLNPPVDGSTGAGPIDKLRNESFFYYKDTVEVNQTIADSVAFARRQSRYTEFFDSLDASMQHEAEETKQPVNRR
jgi:hypothetical protein